MNFYVSISQLLQTIEGLEKNFGFLAERAFRISPRDSRANREILEHCASKMEEAKELLEDNGHISKITLRHASLLLQLFRLSFLRMSHLASATLAFEGDGGEPAKAVQPLFLTASRHFTLLKEVLSDLTGIPLSLELHGAGDKKDQGLDVFQREESYQQLSLSLLDKAIEIFDEEPELLETLAAIRQDLVETRKKIKRLTTVMPARKSQAPAFSRG
ncbi:MAG TPA: hypothetical protein VJ873_04520 [bacterium]|nr:hypothetical protein [bacterium]